MCNPFRTRARRRYNGNEITGIQWTKKPDEHQSKPTKPTSASIKPDPPLVALGPLLVITLRIEGIALNGAEHLPAGRHG